MPKRTTKSSQVTPGTTAPKPTAKQMWDFALQWYGNEHHRAENTLADFRSKIAESTSPWDYVNHLEWRTASVLEAGQFLGLVDSPTKIADKIVEKGAQIVLDHLKGRIESWTTQLLEQSGFDSNSTSPVANVSAARKWAATQTALKQYKSLTEHLEKLIATGEAPISPETTYTPSDREKLATDVSFVMSFAHRDTTKQQVEAAVLAWYRDGLKIGTIGDARRCLLNAKIASCASNPA